MQTKTHIECHPLSSAEAQKDCKLQRALHPKHACNMEDKHMPTLQELFKKYNLVPNGSPNSGPRARLLAQVDRMLKEISSYKEAAEMNGDTTKYWWAPQPVNGQRRVAMRYGGQVVQETAFYVDDSLPAVKALLQEFKQIITDSDDATWAAEEERRAKKS